MLFSLHPCLLPAMLRLLLKFSKSWSLLSTVANVLWDSKHMAGCSLLCPFLSAGLWQGLMTATVGIVYFPYPFAQNVLWLLAFYELYADSIFMSISKPHGQRMSIWPTKQTRWWLMKPPGIEQLSCRQIPCTEQLRQGNSCSTSMDTF